MEAPSKSVRYAMASPIVLTHPTNVESSAHQSFVRRINLNAITVHALVDRIFATNELTVSMDRMSLTVGNRTRVASKRLNYFSSQSFNVLIHQVTRVSLLGFWTMH